MDWQDWQMALVAPFDPQDVDFKPQTMSKDGNKALAIAFVDPRRYQERLSQVFGVAGWSVEYRELGEKAIIAKLTIRTPDGQVVREEVGEFEDGDKARYPSASAQAFKRACVTLGIGRYLYDLPQTWVTVENRRITDSELARLRSQLTKATPPAPKQGTRPSQTAPLNGKPLPNGREGMQNAKAIARISELIGQAKDIGLDLELPANWQALGYDEMVDLGKRITQYIADES